jgi:hypothetical protein
VSFRSGLLEGRRIAVTGPAAADAPAGEIDRAVLDRLRALGAQIVDDPVEPPDALVFLADEPFASGGGDRLQATLELVWHAALGAGLHASGRGGRLVFVGPRSEIAPARAHVEAARAGLENLARTLSVEWARFGVTAVAVMPGPDTGAAEVADLVAYLLSDAGGYFSGCRFSLGTVAPSPPARA